MPDWTYLPLRRITATTLGIRRSQRFALAVVSGVARVPGGTHVVRAMDYTHRHPEALSEVSGLAYYSPVGVVISGLTTSSRDALLAMGFGFVTSVPPSGAVEVPGSTIESILEALDSGAQLVLVNNPVIELGPCVAQRVNEVLAQRKRVERSTNVGELGVERVSLVRFWTWPAWVWALWLGIAMVCAGIGAAIISLGPVLLGYDVNFLRANVSDLRAVNDQLVPFIQHDRITMAGCMMAIGMNDIGMALGIRRGWRWARANFAIAGAVGFPTFFLFLGYRFLDPLHLAVAVGFFPLYLLGVFGRKVPPTWRVPVKIDEASRRRAVVGQLIMVSVALGVLFAGVYIMVIGLTDVLIPSDRAYLNGSQAAFTGALDGRLLRFIAHDRAGFGGALTSLGAGILGTILWGWRAGERSTFWALLAASTCGLGAALAVHWSVGYTDVFHLLPVYLAVPLVGVALLLSREWFFRKV